MVFVFGDLRLQGLVFFACLVFPFLGAFILRRKWHKSVARTVEVQRLLVLAKEESARAELEASYAYGDVFPHHPPRDYLCAVCYCPTTTRCSRCKAVRYCSGKCQIIHWRQGHKENCHPPEDLYEFGWESVDNQSDDYHGDVIVNNVEPPSDSTLTDQNVASVFESRYSDQARVKLETESSSSVQSPGASFSGFSSSSDEITSSDDACGESIYSNVSGGSDERLADVNTQDHLGNCSDDQVNEAKSHPQIFPSSINSVDGSSGGLSESGKSIPPFENDDDGCPTLGPPAKLPDFWGSNLISDEKEISSRSHLQSPSRWEHQIQNASDSGLHLPFAFSLAEKNASSLYTKNLGDEFIGDNVLCHINKQNISTKATISKYKKPGLDNEYIKFSSQPTNREDESALFNTKVDVLSTESLKFCHLQQPVLPVEEHSAGEDNMNIAVSSHLSSSAPNSLKESVDTGIYWPLGSSLLKHESSVQGADKVRSSDGKGIFSYELFVELYTWKEVELLPCGFMNCGNSCYANSILQCLAFTPPLTAYFLQGFHSRTCAKKDWCFMCEFERLILKAKVGISPISPIGIVSQLRNIGSQLNNGRQEDAHEFLRYVTDAMQSICLVKSGGICTSLEEETTLIGLTFGGYLRSKIRCTKCQSKSERQERMMDLTLEIEGNIGSLEEALHRFTESETLDGDNKYQCSSCKSYEKARKKLTILDAPNILTITLKRFQSGRYGKINKRITFPEILNLAPYMSGTSDKLSVYRLYGVIVHLDVMNATFSGHYICYVKNPRNKWFKIDDSMVTPVELESVLQMGAYILLYSRCSPRAPRSIRNSVASADRRHRVPAKTNGRLSALNAKSTGRLPSDVHPIMSPAVGSASIKTFDPEEDSSSDDFSLFGSNSDEGSCSTDSTRDSASMDDLLDYILRDVRGSSSPWRSSDSETSSSTSSSPAHSRQPQVLRHHHQAVEKSGVSLATEVTKLSSRGSNLVSESRSERWNRVDPFGDVNSDSVVTARKIDDG